MTTIVVTGLVGLNAALEEAAVKALPAMALVAATSGAALEALWRSNARATARKHGRWYPSSITHEVKLRAADVSAEVGPDRSKRQGGMGPGFEFGSVKQPPHLDGTKASRTIEPQFLAEIEAAAAGLL